MDDAAKRLELLKTFLVHVRERLGLSVGFRLWDGGRVPADLGETSFAIAIADEGAVAGLIRKPKIETLANLWAAKRIDLVNGTIFDLAAQKPKVRTRHFFKSLNKLLALRLGWAFLRVPRGDNWPLEPIKVDRESDGSAAENKKKHCLSLRRVERVLRTLAR